MIIRAELEKKLLTVQRKLVGLESDADNPLFSMDISAAHAARQALEREGSGLRGEIEALMAKINAFDDLGAQIQAAKAEAAELRAERMRVAKTGDIAQANALLARCTALQEKVEELKQQQAKLSQGETP